MEATSTVRYCWVCEEPVEPGTARTDRHYETGRAVVFCSPCHHDEYRQLAEL